MSSDASAAIAAIAACAQAALLIVAAIIAYRQVQEARRVREEQAQPYVVVSLETDPASPFLLYLVIKNMGKTVAREVFVSFDPPLVSSLDEQAGSNRVTEWTALSEGIRTLVPGQSMGTLVDSLMSRYADGGSSQFPGRARATVSYKDDGRPPKGYSYEYDLDFNVFFGQHWVGRKSFDDLVKSVDSIRRSLESWTTDRGIRVYGKSLDDLEAEKAAHYEQIRARWETERNGSRESRNDSDAEAEAGDEAGQGSESDESAAEEKERHDEADGESGGDDGSVDKVGEDGE